MAKSIWASTALGDDRVSVKMAEAWPSSAVTSAILSAGGGSSSRIVMTPRPSAITAETGLPSVTLKVSLPSKRISSLITTDAVAEIAPAGMIKVVVGMAP